MRHAADAVAVKRRTYNPEPDHDTGDTLTCRAGGCSLHGSVSVGSTTGPFMCSFHAYADPSLWPGISRGLREHDWMLGLMSDLRKLLADGKRGEAMDFARDFWAGDDEMFPSDYEARHPTQYMYRLHNDLQFRVGARSKKPEPMRPQAEAWGKASVKPATNARAICEVQA